MSFRPGIRLASTFLYAPRFLFVETFEHQERIVRTPGLLESEVIQAVPLLLLMTVLALLYAWAEIDESKGARATLDRPDSPRSAAR